MKIHLTCTASGTTHDLDPIDPVLVVMRTSFNELPNTIQGSEVGGMDSNRMTAYDFLLEFQAGAERDRLNHGRTPRAMLGHSRVWYVYDPGMDAYWATTVQATGELDVEVPILDQE